METRRILPLLKGKGRVIHVINLKKAASSISLGVKNWISIRS